MLNSFRSFRTRGIALAAIVALAAFLATTAHTQAAHTGHIQPQCGYAIDVSNTLDTRQAVTKDGPAYINVVGSHVFYWDETFRRWWGGDDNYSQTYGRWYPVTEVHGSLYLHVMAPCSTHLLAYEDSHNGGWIYYDTYNRR